MEEPMSKKRTCKLCFKTFPNGRSLGGHMRSHVTTLNTNNNNNHSSDLYDDDVDSSKISYALRSNPKRSFRVIGSAEFSSASAVESDGDDHESSLRKRSKVAEDGNDDEELAISLMMLSRDSWAPPPPPAKSGPRDDDDEEEESNGIRMVATAKGRRSKFRCDTCRRVFRSYQALGGHRASCHKKSGGSSNCCKIQEEGCIEERVTLEHECPVCFRVFGSGQALGGHKRSHMIMSSRINHVVKSKIDLNLPAPMEDDADQVSVLSDAEFVAADPR